MKNKFKVGDKVFDKRCGGIAIITISREKNAPLDVNSPDHIGIWQYLLDGQWLANEEDITFPTEAAKILYSPKKQKKA